MFTSKGRHRKPTTRRWSRTPRTVASTTVDRLAGHDILAARDRDMEIAAAITKGVPLEQVRSVWARPTSTYTGRWR